MGCLWDQGGGRGGGGRKRGEIRTGQREKMSRDNVPTEASANPMGALELEWPFRIIQN